MAQATQFIVGAIYGLNSPRSGVLPCEVGIERLRKQGEQVLLPNGCQHKGENLGQRRLQAVTPVVY